MKKYCVIISPIVQFDNLLKLCSHLSTVFLDIVASAARSKDPGLEVAQFRQLEFRVARADRRAGAKFAFRRKTGPFGHHRGGTRQIRRLAGSKWVGLRVEWKREWKRECGLVFVPGRPILPFAKVFGCKNIFGSCNYTPFGTIEKLNKTKFVSPQKKNINKKGQTSSSAVSLFDMVR